MKETPPTQTRFHSRLTAQWAIFYETLGVPYAYRAHTVKLPDGVYTPDFWLPDQQAWVEICATYPHAEDAARAQALVAATGQPVYFFCSEFRSPTASGTKRLTAMGMTNMGLARTTGGANVPCAARWVLPTQAGVGNCRVAVFGAYTLSMRRNIPTTHRAWKPPTTPSAR